MAGNVQWKLAIVCTQQSPQIWMLSANEVKCKMFMPIRVAPSSVLFVLCLWSLGTVVAFLFRCFAQFLFVGFVFAYWLPSRLCSKGVWWELTILIDVLVGVSLGVLRRKAEGDRCSSEAKPFQVVWRETPDAELTITDKNTATLWGWEAKGSLTVHSDHVHPLRLLPQLLKATVRKRPGSADDLRCSFTAIFYLSLGYTTDKKTHSPG